MSHFTDGFEVDATFNNMADFLIEMGWENTSWRNDICPSFSKGNSTIFIDRLKVELREMKGFKRFIITQPDVESILTDSIRELQDWVIAAAEHKGESNE